MRRKSYLALQIATTCLLATVAVGAISMHSPAEAVPNSCTTHHANVLGYDAGPFNSYGNKGYIYINTQDTLMDLHDYIWRSFEVAADAFDYVEFGWTDHNSNITSPTAVSDWAIDGQFSKVNPYNFPLSYNTDVRFRIENVGTQNIWRFVIDGQSSPIGYSPALAYSTGFEITNSEHDNSCDSMWTHMWDLSFSLPEGNWNSGYQDLEQECNSGWDTDGNGWVFDKFSNSELQVNQTSGSVCG